MIDDHGLSPEARGRWHARHARPADARHARRAHAGERLRPRRAGAAGAVPGAGRHAVPARGLLRGRCRCWPTAARWASCSVGFGRRVAFDADQRALLNALAAQAAIALARAQLYEREHTVSQTLQASLLPRALPVVPGLDLAGRLEAGAQGVEVGGDFYDAFAVGDGAWGIAIGDVCGKGVDAAALTALARHTVRAAAHAHDSPARRARARSTARCSTRAARASS